MDEVRGIIRKKRRGSGMKAHNIAQQAKGLEGRLGVWMDLRGSHVECPKDVHCEFLSKGRETCKSEKRQVYM